MTSRLAGFILAAALASCCMPALAGSLEDGLAAYRRLDFDTAREALMPLAIGGDARAQSTLGDMYLGGRGVPLNSFLAAKWYRAAAKQGNAHAQARLGQLYLRGRGVGIDYARAVQWLSAAANQGDADAQLCLAGMLAVGEGVEQDRVAAYVWLSLAALGNRDTTASRDRDLLATHMTHDEIARAREEARVWRSQPAPDLGALHAEE
jgi:TPR repeat protein